MDLCFFSSLHPHLDILHRTIIFPTTNAFYYSSVKMSLQSYDKEVYYMFRKEFPIFSPTMKCPRRQKESVTHFFLCGICLLLPALLCACCEREI